MLSCRSISCRLTLRRNIPTAYLIHNKGNYLARTFPILDVRTKRFYADDFKPEIKTAFEQAFPASVSSEFYDSSEKGNYEGSHSQEKDKRTNGKQKDKRDRTITTKRLGGNSSESSFLKVIKKGIEETRHHNTSSSKTEKFKSHNKGENTKKINSSKKTVNNKKATAIKSHESDNYKGTIWSHNLLKYEPLPEVASPNFLIPRLRPDLEKVLFSPGVHFFEDPRTKHKNFKPCDIPNIDEIKVERLPIFHSASNHQPLHDAAEQYHDKRYGKFSFASSTSSMTGLLKDLHLLLSNNRPLNISSLSKQIRDASHVSFSPSTYLPTTVLVRRSKNRPNVYSISSEQLSPSETTLSIMGHVFEIMLTSDNETMKTFLKSHKNETNDVSEEIPSAYHYAKIGSFVIRSQLDTFSENLPGSGTFDLKARAVCAIRNDLPHSQFYDTHYSIHQRTGRYESFEREIFDLARTTLIKYAFQAKMGNMDGIFVAFHNLSKIFGFQYLPLTEINHIIHGYDSDPMASSKIIPENLDVIEPRPNVEVLDHIASSVPSHYLSHRELISSKIADFEFSVSFQILTKLLKMILSVDRHTPFRLSTTFYPSKYNEPTLEVLVTFINDSLLDEYNRISTNASDMSKKLILEQQERMKDSPELFMHEEELVLSELLKRIQKDQKSLSQDSYEINKKIWETAKKNKQALLFRITTKHKFDKVDAKTSHPTPPHNFISPEDPSLWEVDYEIQRIKEDDQLEEAYRNHLRATTRMRSVNVTDDDIYGLNYENELAVSGSKDESIYTASTASNRQKTLRAFSVRGKVRESLADDYLAEYNKKRGIKKETEEYV